MPLKRQFCSAMQGLIVINKPKDRTSFGVGARLRKILGEKRIGHTGTLDPMATGVLVCLVGRPCVLSNYIMSGSKGYIAKLKLGIKTDSYDITGEVINSSQKTVSKEEFLEATNSFIGESMQLPPMFSAKKVDGQKLYELARKGETITRTPSKINIYKIELLSFCNNEAEIFVSCSKGTYIRSLIDDIGEKLGCFATMTELVRTENGGFSIENSINLEELTNENAEDFIISAENAVKNYKEIMVTQKQAVRFYNGGELDINRIYGFKACENEVVRIKYQDKFVGLGVKNGECIKVLCPIENPNQ